jgi:gas vesicle protein
MNSFVALLIGITTGAFVTLLVADSKQNSAVSSLRQTVDQLEKTLRDQSSRETELMQKIGTLEAVVVEKSHLLLEEKKAREKMRDYDAEQCGADSAEFVRNRGVRRPTACPQEEDIIRPWAAARHSREPNHRWTIVDVGVNKGYTMVSLLRAIGLTHKYSHKQLGLQVFEYARELSKDPTRRNKIEPRSLCGACCDCLESDFSDAPFTYSAGFYFLGFDGAPVYIDFLRDRFKSEDGNNFTFKNAALFDKEGEAISFPDALFGEEMNGINVNHNRRAVVQLTSTTIDREVEHLPYIDILITDMEGHDLIGARGARAVLESKRVGFYLFELHTKKTVGITRHTDPHELSLESHVQWLSSLGYQCYLLFDAHRRTRLVNITYPTCWMAQFNSIRGWANAFCVNADEPELIEAVRKISTGDIRCGDGGTGRENCRHKVLKLLSRTGFGDIARRV